MRKIFLAVVMAVAAVAEAQPTESYEPRVLAHVCTWLKQNAWGAATIRPMRGPYRSSDGAVLEQQLAQMRTANIAPLVSWMGPDDDSGDKYLDMLVTVQNSGVPAAILYEGQARLRARRDGWIDFDDEFNRERFAADMRHLHAKYFSRYPERFLQEEGRFVVMAWPSHIYRGQFRQTGLSLMAELPLYLVSTDLLTRPYVRSDAADVIGGFAAVSAYGIYLPEIARELGGTLDERWLGRWQAMANAWDAWLAANEPQVRIALPLQFAFDDHILRGDENPILTTDYTQAEEMVRRVHSAITDSRARAGRYLRWTTASSWSEYFEGSSIEPSDRHGTRFLDIIRAGFVVGAPER